MICNKSEKAPLKDGAFFLTGFLDKSIKKEYISTR